ncbi:hypothetical protein XcuCFBP2542_18730 [Xanthomonas cucurbitae]|uniref:DUF4189 domain-containing protein n=1 Tax=Xanthomonas cucurbitae TaxID=56453 RepID=A0A2S7D9I5_9XANT|nr:DUF4189 domain-containing protein [Xanthomonas cucurbitae]PPU70475.1 hypothetical protein XcuCFBP2542_18730 [Xanthomonas cucurbitae]WDM80347.1 DUF4189 domain-containing protein [Xanthomonas cucurbitae]WDM84037.1 DUF4189 domain-containing protein [Xanthomonas cucurbitae]
MKYLIILALSIFLISTGVRAEQGCPPGQIPAQSNGSMSSCGPIPSGYYQEQPVPSPRPLGKWIKTWGAIAGDGNENLGVSTGKLKKADAQQDAIERCEAESQKKCSVLYVYENRCVAISEPGYTGNITRGFAAGPSIDVASRNAVSFCSQENKGRQCKVIYTACTEPFFQRF